MISSVNLRARWKNMFLFRWGKIRQQNQMKQNIKWKSSQPKKSDAKIKKSISPQKYLPTPPWLDTIMEQNITKIQSIRQEKRTVP